MDQSHCLVHTLLLIRLLKMCLSVIIDIDLHLFENKPDYLTFEPR